MSASKPSIFLGGFRLLLANKRTLLWSYLALLAVGLIGGASMNARVGPFLDHSLAAQKLSAGIDMAYYIELVRHTNEHDPGTGPVTAALTLISILLSFFFAAGFIYVFLTGERPRLATILRAGVEYFWRFFRLLLFAAIIAAIILGPLGWLRTVYLKHADEKFVEAAYDLRAAITLVVLILIVLLLRIWFDLAEVLVVQSGQQGDRRVRRSIGPAFRLLRHHFGQLFVSYFTAGTLGVFGFLFFVWIWFLGQTSHSVLPVFLLSQIGLIFLLASRIWQRGIVTSLVLATTPPSVVIVEPVPVYVAPAPPYSPDPTPGEPISPEAEPIAYEAEPAEPPHAPPVDPRPILDTDSPAEESVIHPPTPRPEDPLT